MQKIKRKFVPHFVETSSNIEEFNTLLGNVNTNHIKEGTVVKGQVVDVQQNVIIVDVGLKTEDRIAKEEFLTQGQILPQIGDIVEVFVEKLEDRNGRTILSREKAVREESWKQLEIAHDKGEVVTGVIFGRVKGGLTVDLSGVVAFLPGSQVDVRPIKDVSHLMNTKQNFQILKMDKKLGNIVISRRAIIEGSRSEARDEILSQIKEGMILEGVVKNITDYGAFIDLGNIDGLVHVTDISWSRINHPSEVLELHQPVKVMVTKFDEETKRISLGIKQLNNIPWQTIKDEFPIGKIMTGKITNIKDYGAFIELKNGIEGLVHSSEINWVKSVKTPPKKLLSIGQEVQFMIFDIDMEKHRISLSIKRCQENPFLKFAATHQVGSVIKAPVRNIVDFAIFVVIDQEANIDGMIHISDISWDAKEAELFKSQTKEGDIIECQVLSIDMEKEQVGLGIKQLTQAPEGDAELDTMFQKGDVVTCVISAIKEDSVEVDVGDSTTGTIKKSELSSDRTEQKPERFVVGDRVDAKIISIDKNLGKLVLSIKALEIEERKKVIKEYGSPDSGASLGGILGAALSETQKK